MDRSRVGVVGVGSGVRFDLNPGEQGAASSESRLHKQLVYSCFYIVTIGATRLQEVSYILAKISDVD